MQNHRNEINTAKSSIDTGRKNDNKTKRFDGPDVRRRVSICEIATDMIEQARTQPLFNNPSRSASTPSQQVIRLPTAPFSRQMAPTSPTDSLSPGQHQPISPGFPQNLPSCSSMHRVKAQKSQEFMPPQYELLTAPRGNKRTIRMSKNVDNDGSFGQSSVKDGPEESDARGRDPR